jgi:threonine/homoserine/homoserine lactone efflux protein
MLTRDQVNIIHVLIVGPLLVYVGRQQLKTPLHVFNLLALLGGFVIVYHGFTYIKRNKYL